MTVEMEQGIKTHVFGISVLDIGVKGKRDTFQWQKYLSAEQSRDLIGYVLNDQQLRSHILSKCAGRKGKEKAGDEPAYVVIKNPAVSMADFNVSHLYRVLGLDGLGGIKNRNGKEIIPYIATKIRNKIATIWNSNQELPESVIEVDNPTDVDLIDIHPPEQPFQDKEDRKPDLGIKTYQGESVITSLPDAWGGSVVNYPTISKLSNTPSPPDLLGSLENHRASYARTPELQTPPRQTSSKALQQHEHEHEEHEREHRTGPSQQQRQSENKGTSLSAILAEKLEDSRRKVEVAEEECYFASQKLQKEIDELFGQLSLRRG